MMLGRDLWHVACRFVNRAPALSDTSQRMGDTQIFSVTAHALSAADGMPLRADFYVPAAAEATADRGLIVLLHGYCEHRGRYRHVAEHLIKDGYTVLTAASGRTGLAAVRRVELGASVGESWLVQSGLQAGDRVIVDGLQRARPGAPVTPVPWP